MHRNTIFRAPIFGVELFTCILVMSASACYARSDQTLEQEIKTFNEGNFAKSSAIGHELVTANPTNVTARYYYAQALAKLNRTSEAVLQFSQCANMAKDPTLKSYSQKALENLTRASTTLSSSSSPSFSPPILSDTLKTGQQSNPDPLSTQGVELNSLKVKALEGASGQIKALREQADRDIQAAKNLAAEQMQGIPQFIIRSIYTRGRILDTVQMPNLDFPEANERSQAELAKTTEKINANFTRRESEIMADCNRRTAGYDQVRTGMQSQGKPGTSLIQLTPQNSNTYIRHYVNYDGGVPSALKAKAGALQNNKQQAEIVVNKTAK